MDIPDEFHLIEEIEEIVEHGDMEPKIYLTSKT